MKLFKLPQNFRRNGEPTYGENAVFINKDNITTISGNQQYYSNELNIELMMTNGICYSYVVSINTPIQVEQYIQNIFGMKAEFKEKLETIVSQE